MKLRTAAIVVATAFPMMSLGCGQEAKPYKPKPAYSGKRPSLPAVPTLPNKKKKIGDAYTVWGATHDLRSKVHKDDFRDKQITIVGYIVKTNYEDAPVCAIHKTGKADPPECKAPTSVAVMFGDRLREKYGSGLLCRMRGCAGQCRSACQRSGQPRQPDARKAGGCFRHGHPDRRWQPRP